MGIIEQLKQKLTAEYLADEDKIEERFKEIAEILLGEVAIKKGDKLLWITDVEFYWYTDSHRDIITYPRNCEPGKWFFHSSGVDISFESKVKTDGDLWNPAAILTPEAKFGGILIRGICPKNDEGKKSKDYNFDGPMKSVNYLFDIFDAFSEPSGVPLIVEDQHEIVIERSPRKNLLVKKTAEEKVEAIKRYNYSDKSDFPDNLIESFKEFKEKKYRFFTK